MEQKNQRAVFYTFLLIPAVLGKTVLGNGRHFPAKAVDLFRQTAMATRIDPIYSAFCLSRDASLLALVFFLHCTKTLFQFL